MTRSASLLTFLSALAICSSGLHAQNCSYTYGRPSDGSLIRINGTSSPSIQITSLGLPDATVGIPYGAQFTAAEGTPPYSWSVSGLPAGLSYDSKSGIVRGIPEIAGYYVLCVSVSDASDQSATATSFISVMEAAPLRMVTTSLTPGVVGTAYATGFTATGGFSPYTFTLSSGVLPAGLTLTSAGVLAGTPTAFGQFRFSVKVTDSNGITDIGDYLLTIAPAPLAVTGTVGNITAGSPINLQFGASGGVPPYTFAISGSIPSGTRLSNGALTGTANSAGTFQFTVAVTDSRGTVATRTFILTITAAPLRVTGTAPNGQVGAAYAAPFDAVGGTPPYTFSAIGLPPGLRLTGSTLTGTPTSEGTFVVTLAVTDATGARASGEFTLTVTPPPLVIGTRTLPNGTVGSAYDATLAATGGVAPYVWTVTGAPEGVTAASNGILSGTPTQAGSYTLNARVADAKGTITSASFILTVAIPPLAVSTATLPAATVGTAFNTTLAATGGVSPYTFSATGLPAGVTLSPAGVLSGTATAPGSTTIAIMVRDSSGASVTRNYTLDIGLPSAPAVNLTGLPAASNPSTQPRLQIGLGAAYPGPVTVTLTLTFTADSGPDDPAVQFSSGGRTAQITVPAGSTTAATDVGVQTGTVAGNITITARLSAFSSDITPAPAPVRTIRITPTAPVISSVTSARNPTGFTVTINGYASSRELTQATFQFGGAAGSTLQTTQLAVTVDALFTQWYTSSAAAPFGSQFTFTQPFTVQGSTQSVASVTVTLTNRVGTSSPVTANLQ